MSIPSVETRRDEGSGEIGPNRAIVRQNVSVTDAPIFTAVGSPSRMQWVTADLGWFCSVGRVFRDEFGAFSSLGIIFYDSRSLPVKSVMVPFFRPPREVLKRQFLFLT
jgi:hypothetical protein